MKEGNGPPADNTKAAFINNTMHSLISSLKVFINDKCINSNTEDYNYKEYIHYMTSYDNQAKTSTLTSQGYFEDREALVIF